jgi:hypothetical protein
LLRAYFLTTRESAPQRQQIPIVILSSNQKYLFRTIEIYDRNCNRPDVELRSPKIDPAEIVTKLVGVIPIAMESTKRWYGTPTRGDAMFKNQ